MKVYFLVVVACIDFGGSYYDQTSLSSVLSAFEARLTLPRSKAAGVSANESAPDPAALSTSAPVSAALATCAATEASTEVATENATSAATEASTEVATEDATSAATEASTEVATENARSAATETSTEAAMSAPASENDYIKEESQTSKEGLLPVHEIRGSQSTVPNVAPPSHCATNTVSSPTVGSVHSWSFKEVAIVAHAGQILWLAVLTGTMFYFLAVSAHLWNVTYELRRTRV